MAKKVKQSRAELNLIRARHKMSVAWLHLDTAITAYNMYLENKLTNKNK